MGENLTHRITQGVTHAKGLRCVGIARFLAIGSPNITHRITHGVTHAKRLRCVGIAMFLAIGSPNITHRITQNGTHGSHMDHTWITHGSQMYNNIKKYKEI